MGLCYHTTKWADRLWSEHLDSSAEGRALLKAGISKQGNNFAGFPADLHARLYLPSEPQRKEEAPQWGTRLHEMSLELGEWHQLKLMTARNGFASGVAAEVMLKILLPHVPKRSEESPKTENKNREESDAELRAALRKAAREARKVVNDAEAALMGMSPDGQQSDSGRMNLKSIRDAYERLKNSPRLAEISKLAGRFERITASKIRSAVNPGVGEIHGVDYGSELAKLLPSETVHLRNPILKRAVLAKVLEGRALVYATKGKEVQGKGPIVILLDESGSMGDAKKDVWSKAIALAITNRATKERRSVHIVTFSKQIRSEVTIKPQTKTPAQIQEALDRKCKGGTDFDNPIKRACEIIKAEPLMKQADVLMITDGEQEVAEETINHAKELTKTAEVSWLIVGIGDAAIKVIPKTIGKIATTVYLVKRTDNTDSVANIVALKKEVK